MPEGHTIHRLAKQHARLLQGEVVRAASPQGRFAEGAELLDGRVLEATDAWGKHLFHRYTGRVWLHIHLGLYGKFTVGTRPAPEPRGALRLRLEGGGHWLDLRGPITCEVLTTREKAAVCEPLGPDPLRARSDPDRTLLKLSRSRAPVAALLMDQTVVAGIGNVYRAEILFRHGVDPYLPGRELPADLWLAMWSDLGRLMRAGVRSGRIVTTEPADRSRRTGAVRRIDAHYVYRRAGEPCRHCGTLVRRAELVGRNLFWCPRCQPGNDQPVGSLGADDPALDAADAADED